MIAGVCGGLGHYFGVDPTFVRLLFVFLAFYHFLGVWVYLVMAILLPTVSDSLEERQAGYALPDKSQTTRVIGGGLILLGILAIISTLNIPLLGWLRMENVWPALIIMLGLLLLARAFISEE
jgi:phage shock protein PspC (stress-responsive transcriptional regulator)